MDNTNNTYTWNYGLKGRNNYDIPTNKTAGRQIKFVLVQI